MFSHSCLQDLGNDACYATASTGRLCVIGIAFSPGGGCRAVYDFLSWPGRFLAIRGLSRGVALGISSPLATSSARCCPASFAIGGIGVAFVSLVALSTFCLPCAPFRAVTVVFVAAQATNEPVAAFVALDCTQPGLGFHWLPSRKKERPSSGQAKRLVRISLCRPKRPRSFVGEGTGARGNRFGPSLEQETVSIAPIRRLLDLLWREGGCCLHSGELSQTAKQGASQTATSSIGRTVRNAPFCSHSVGPVGGP
jgi:hypothetical protein